MSRKPTPEEDALRQYLAKRHQERKPLHRFFIITILALALILLFIAWSQNP